MVFTLGWLSWIFVINILLAFVVIFLERKDPTATLAWVLVLLMIPILGFVGYIFLAQNFSRKKLFEMKIIEKKIYGSYIQRQEDAIKNEKFEMNEKDLNQYLDLLKMNVFSNKAHYSQDNQIKVFTDGKDKFRDLKDSIENASNHIHLLYYIIKDDETSRALIELLTKKAEEGVEVRLIYDSIGGREVKQSALKELKEAGGLVGEFFKSPLFGINLKMNYRNHRKIAIIDGKTGYLGGFNIGDEYKGLNEKIGYWRDTHIKIYGSAVRDLQIRFMLDWRSTGKDDLSYTPKYFPYIDGEGDKGIQIISSGPDTPYERIKQNYVKMISMAKKSIYIQTPYFVPDSSVIDSIKIAAMSGVDVRIMIPNKPDHPFVYWASLNYVGELLKFGVKVYTYENGFLHAKTMVVDDKISSVGTANFDVRSFKLNFEVNAIIYSKETSQILSNAFKKDIELSNELTRELYLERRLTVRFKESVSRLLSPIL